MCWNSEDVSPAEWMRWTKEALRDGHEMTPGLRHALLDWLTPYWVSKHQVMAKPAVQEQA